MAFRRCVSLLVNLNAKKAVKLSGGGCRNITSTGTKWYYRTGRAGLAG